MKTITEERRVVTFDEAASILGYTPRSIRVLFYKMKKQNGSAPKIVKKDGRTAYYDLDELLLHLAPAGAEMSGRHQQGGENPESYA